MVEKEIKGKGRTLYSLDLKAKECGNKTGVQHLYPGGGEKVVDN